MDKNPDFARKYKEFMKEYETLGHMSESDFQFNSEHYVIPLYGIFKKGSDKLRVVFDGSGKTSSIDGSILRIGSISSSCGERTLQIKSRYIS